MHKEGKIQFITDPRNHISMTEQVEQVCAAGLDWVQYRNKEKDYDAKVEEGRELAKICHKYNTKLIINDHPELARDINADGVHLGLQDMTPQEARAILGDNKIIGGTCNTMEHIRLRHEQGVDYIGLGPFRFTTTKKNLSPILGIEGYQKIFEICKKERINIPTVAIGGIQHADIPELLSTGLHGIAISSLILNAESIEDSISELRKLVY
jgi:thiamine-phosphate pyrophosphorylase